MEMFDAGCIEQCPGSAAQRKICAPTEFFSVCEGFRMTAHRDDLACTGAGVRKPPGKEPAGDEMQTVTRALWGFDRGVDGGRWGRERGGQVMPGAGGSRALFRSDEDVLRGQLRRGKGCRVAVWSSVAVAGWRPARNALDEPGA